MTDPGLNQLLKWGIENSDASRREQNGQETSQASSDSTRGLDPQVLAALLGGPSDADLMREAMAAIVSPEVDLDNKLVAFDNFEQLVEGIDNANNMESLGLWMPLVDQLRNEEARLREMAAWCVGTAVQNNARAQERLLALGAIPTLVSLATNDPSAAVRKKAIRALSSGVRNYQPGLDVAMKNLPEQYQTADKPDAANMESVDEVVQKLRQNSESKGS